MAKEILKTADASMAAQLRDPNKVICRALHPTDKAFLPTGDVIQFVNGMAEVTREQAEHLQDPLRFAYDVPYDPVVPVLSPDPATEA